MRILVLGGTAWLGGAIAAEAVRGGHEVVCLARGSAPVPVGAALVRADRDLAAWLVRSAESGTAGVFNAGGQVLPLTEHLAAASDGTATPAPAPEQWLLDHGVAEWSGPRSLPLRLALLHALPRSCGAQVLMRQPVPPHQHLGVATARRTARERDAGARGGR